MSTKQKTQKLLISNGSEALTLRHKLGLNQSDFWKRIFITQSCGSRYEAGRNISKSVLQLLNLAYAPEKQALAMLSHLRSVE
jgi:hypothetical protein